MSLLRTATLCIALLQPLGAAGAFGQGGADTLRDLYNRSSFIEADTLDLRAAVGDSLANLLERDRPALVLRVMDARTGRAVPFATLILVSVAQGDTLHLDSLGVQGRCETAQYIAGIPRGEYDLHVRLVGYGAATTRLALPARTVARLIAVLYPRRIRMDGW
jgi:hypothetical protein